MSHEDRIRAIGREIFAAMGGGGGSAWTVEGWKDRALQAGMAVPFLKPKFLLLLDVSPTLKTPDQLKEYLLELLTDPEVPAWLPWLFKPVPGFVLAPLTLWAMRWIAVRFVAGSDLAQAKAAIGRLRARGSDAIVDLLGEGLTSHEEADRHRDTYLELLRSVERAQVSVKLSALGSNFDALNRASHLEIRERLRAIVEEARKRPDCFVWVDMEHHALKDITLSIYKQVREEFPDFERLGIAIQAYLKETEKDLKGLLAWAAARGRKVPVRLVKGAYWDQENIWAAKAGWPVPVWPEKTLTDLSFERRARFLLENREHFVPAFGTHNVRSIASAIASAEELGVPRDGYEFQMLYGMGDPIRGALAQKGYRTRVYCPYGELIPGMAYLVRRVLENTANESFLRQTSAGRPVEELLESPEESARKGGDRILKSHTEGFRNEPLTDWSDPENQRKMKEALSAARGKFGRRYDPFVGGQTVPAASSVEVRNASNADEVLGTVGQADRALADRAAEAAKAAFEGWRKTPMEERVSCLKKTAQALRGRRFELAAWIVFEVGKNWVEADADVAEAVDFLEYYALEAPEVLKAKELPHLTGVKNSLGYEPLGAGVVIAPWNFPLAILTGMTSAALVAGNAVLMKPAEQSSIVAAKLMEVLAEIFPAGVVNFLPGTGEEVGAHLVAHDDIEFIAFTGSTGTGRAIRKAVAGSRNFNKKIVLETGGKNAIFVDRDADLDPAVKGVLDSAFGYGGQKCSACSRLIVHQDLHDAFLKRLVEMAETLNLGAAEDPSTQVGPLIDAPAFEKTGRYLKLAESEGRLVLAARVDPKRRIVGPAVVAEVEPKSALAQEEIFGPVLSVMKARDLDEAIRLVNAVEFGLTAGIFTRTETHKRRFFAEVRAGVVYANRKITHAQVGVVPFGGVALSGMGVHAGGPDYLRQFVNAKVKVDDLLMYEAGLELR